MPAPPAGVPASTPGGKVNRTGGVSAVDAMHVPTASADRSQSSTTCPVATCSLTPFCLTAESNHTSLRFSRTGLYELAEAAPSKSRNAKTVPNGMPLDASAPRETSTVAIQDLAIVPTDEGGAELLRAAF